MLPTFARRSQYGTRNEGARGVQPWRQRVEYETFRSKYAPHAMISGAFAVAAGTGVLLLFDAVPKVQRDILQKVPIIGPYFVHEVPPEDNPF
ncbi:uncharacterized protein LTR77_002901 [Saxophila tyrrhenica]|uniref:Cytochrome b-c1 complex subunit 10 n=1 Tax=Saxophila tyrrhenica TaxID=1690608 RepID=A0AAV9PGG6_9PEZI|nr:hypothetical protein LTR77_002901 [Saxophila tyrrhenica]